MQVINTSNVYSFVLSEDEWYSGTEQQREAWVNQIMREASEYRCQYAAILVDPDALFSISPVPRRHKVWAHTFPTTREEDFKASLQSLLDSAEDAISRKRLAFLLRAFAEKYDQ